MTELLVKAAGTKRTRCAISGLSTELPELRPRQLALLKEWFRDNAAERQWISLLRTAGPDRLELAEELLNELLYAGIVLTKEKRANNQWSVDRVRWSDIAALQQSAGLRTAADRQADQHAIKAQLQSIADSVPWLESAARDCLDKRLADDVRELRLQLLQSLQSWHQEQRFGMWRDFSQYARGTTKAIKPTEQKWLEEHAPLETLGIANFAPILWLGGELTLQTAHGTIAVAAAGFCGLPMRLFSDGLGISRSPQHYWLIENRASFERQCANPPEGTCVIWLPGRPSSSWCDAMLYLLRIAPAPSLISCDPDPAGVEIALTAGELWQRSQLGWQAHPMGRADWDAAPEIALSSHDLQWLDRLQARTDVPASLRDLCADLRETGRKAEQEFWL